MPLRSLNSYIVKPYTKNRALIPIVSFNLPLRGRVNWYFKGTLGFKNILESFHQFTPTIVMNINANKIN